jgi:hypothetical protein
MEIRKKVLPKTVDFRPPLRLTAKRLLRGDFTMQYLMLIYESEAQWDAIKEPDKQEIYKAYRELIQDLEKASKYKGGNQLQPISTATTVRARNGKAAVTDGPFAETKEQLGGYMLVEAKDLDDALAIAARIPSSRTGSIEVRPVVMH